MGKDTEGNISMESGKALYNTKSFTPKDKEMRYTWEEIFPKIKMDNYDQNPVLL